MLSRHEDSLSYANVDVKTGSPSHGQLIDSQPSVDGHAASRNAEIVIKASHYIMNKYCSGYGGYFLKSGTPPRRSNIYQP